MKSDLNQPRNRLFYLALLTFLTVAFTQIGTAYARLSDSEQLPVSVRAGVWDIATSIPTTPLIPNTGGQSGTSLVADATTEGFSEIQNGTSVFGIRGNICVTNKGERSTEGLQIVATIQHKSEGKPYENIHSNPVDVSAHQVLPPGESNCYPYKFNFEPPKAEKTLYLNTVLVTITNHSGWLPAGNHCPGTAPCPFGPEIKIEFKFPETLISTSTDEIISPNETEMTLATPVPTTETTVTEPPVTESPSAEIPATEFPVTNPPSTTEPPPTDPPSPTEPPPTTQPLPTEMPING